MFASDSQIQFQLQQLADYLSEKRETILEDWREQVQNDARTQDVSLWTRAQFQDHIPLILDALEQQLRSTDDENAAQSQHQATDDHSRHRWQQGYDLRSLVGEWGHLNSCVVDKFYQFAAQHPPLDDGVLRAAQQIWAQMLGECLSDNVVEYHELLQAEASTRARELEQVLAQLRAMEEQRGQALRTAAHDLRGGLSVVMGSASIMDEAKLTDEQRIEVRQMLESGFVSLNDMLTDLMSMARLEAGLETREIQEFDAGELLTTLAAGSQSLARERDLYLRARGPASMLAQGDAVKVRRIAQNLLLNGLKYTTHGGVTMNWGQCERSAGHWELVIEDSGPGLKSGPAAPLAQKLETATEAANQADGQTLLKPDNSTANDGEHPASAPGEGVGLAIVKRLCELLGASIELQTTRGIGSKFRILFPRSY